MDAGECYISYENAPSTWRLSDGSAPPARKPFRDVSYDAEERVFRGTIDWAPHTFGGAVRWEYEMRFSTDFGQIEGGRVVEFKPPPAEGSPGSTTFGDGGDLQYVRLNLGVHEMLARRHELRLNDE